MSEPAKVTPIKDDVNDLLYIQARLSVPKGRKNEFGGFSYRNCEDILNAVKPLLDETGSTLTITDSVVTVGHGEAMRFYMKATATFIDSKGSATQVEGFAREPLTRKGMDDSQVSGSASSYARKYALSGLFLLDDSTDPDEVADITEAEIIQFQDMVDNEDGVSIYAMQIEDYKRFELLRRESAPKGGKTKFIHHVNDLVLQVVDWSKEAAARLIDLADNEDRMGLIEETQELTREQKVIIWRQLPQEYHSKITAVLKS